MSDPTLDTVVSVFFSLEIDAIDLGVFTSCDGLGMEFEVTQRAEGGGGIYVYQLPGRFKYTNLQITRPIGSDTAKTMAWLGQMAGTMRPTTARLAALDPSGKTVFAWVLSGVVPASWKGPSFDATQPQAAKETLELAYTSITAEPPA